MSSFVSPKYTKAEVNRAGKILVDGREHSADEIMIAENIFANWRASHAYPINTFQATLRNRLKNVDNTAIVAQRLKRAPSILAKLRRFPAMQLARMQDIGGLRAIVNSILSIRKLEKIYRAGSFQHELTTSKDYLDNPKDDGYRGIHLIYCYRNVKAQQYDGLRLELQIRTRLQHAWATAVETIGTYLNQSLKSGEGSQEWKNFFTNVSAAFALKEQTRAVPGFEGYTQEELGQFVAEAEKAIEALKNLRRYAQITEHIIKSNMTGRGNYFLIKRQISLKYKDKRITTIRRYSKNRLEEANEEYRKVEKETGEGKPLDVVLVSADSIAALRKAYPNYFEDTTEFVKEIKKIMPQSK